MHVLMISDVYFPRVNGVSTSIRTFRNQLVYLGHKVTLIAPQYSADDIAEDWIIRVPAWTVPFDPEDRIMQRRRIVKLLPELSKISFDLLHIQTPFVAHYAGLELADALNLPRVVTYHTHFEEYFHHYLPWLPRTLLKHGARHINRLQCNQVDAVIVPSSAMQDLLQQYGIKRPMEIIATGIEPHFYHHGDGQRFRRKFNIAPERPTLVHIGRIAHEKNIGFLLEMLDVLRHSIRDILFIIAGEGPAVGHLSGMVNRLHLRDHVLFTGYLDRSGDLLDCYRAGDVFVFGSRTETQGLVLLEAMAQGVPVVSVAELGTLDILQHARGALISELDKNVFAAHVQALLNNRQLRERLSAEASSYAAGWSAHSFAEKAVDFYRRIIHCAGHIRSAGADI